MKKTPQGRPGSSRTQDQPSRKSESTKKEGGGELHKGSEDSTRKNYSETRPSSPGIPLTGLTKMTREQLVERASALGLRISHGDRRADLIERIRTQASGTSASISRPKKTAVPEKGSPRSGQKKALVAPDPEEKMDMILSSHPLLPVPVFPDSDLSSREESAPGWKYFLDIPYEPFRRESGHDITILAVSPLKIMAFFAVDWNRDPDLSRKIREAGVVLKIRDITGAMISHRAVSREENLPVDHVFDIMAGTADRWAIPLWSSHRYLEAWLGFYDEHRFHVLARSKRIRTPRGGPSSRLGSLFHLQEGSPLHMPDTEASWEYSISRRWIKLPTSREFPGHDALS